MSKPGSTNENSVDAALHTFKANLGGDGSPTTSPPSAQTNETPAVSLGDVRTTENQDYVLRDIGEILDYSTPSGFVGSIHVDDKTYAQVGSGPPCATAPPKAVLRALRRSTKPDSDTLADQVEQHIDYLEKEQQEKSESALAAAEPNPRSTEDGAQAPETANPALQHLHQLITEHDVSQDVEAGLLCLPELASKVCGYSRTDLLADRLEREGVEIVEQHDFPSPGVTGVKTVRAISAEAFLDAMDYLDADKGELREFIEMKREYANQSVMEGPPSVSSEVLAHIESQGDLLQKLSEQVRKQGEQVRKRGEQLADVMETALASLQAQEERDNMRRRNNEGEEFLHLAYIRDTKMLRKLVKTEQSRTVETTSLDYGPALSKAYNDVRDTYGIDIRMHKRSHRFETSIDAAEDLHTLAEPVLLYVIDSLVWLRKNHS